VKHQGGGKIIGEEPQRNLQFLVAFFLRENARDPAVERIHEHAADTSRGKNQESPAPYGGQFTTGKVRAEWTEESVFGPRRFFETDFYCRRGIDFTAGGCDRDRRNA